MPEGDTTEAAAIAVLAVDAALSEQAIKGELRILRVPEGHRIELLDFERLLDTPRRTRGIVALHDHESFVRFVREHAGVQGTDGGFMPAEGQRARAETKLYGNVDTHTFVAVFNDAVGWGVVSEDESIQAPAEAEAGWADHRAVLALRKTPEWLFWEAKDGKLMEQHAFAEHIEDGLDEIITPDGATMLELAQTFLAKTDVNFKSSTLITSGQRQFVYEESTSATGGHNGDIKVPTEFVLGLPPFQGTSAVEVRARLRFRLSSGNLSIGYKLIRPHIVLNDAFDDVATFVQEQTLIRVLAGVAPRGQNLDPS